MGRIVDVERTPVRLGFLDHHLVIQTEKHERVFPESVRGTSEENGRLEITVAAATLIPAARGMRCQ